MTERYWAEWSGRCQYDGPWASELKRSLGRRPAQGLARASGVLGDPWSLQCALLRHLAEIWRQPDEGVWETRGGSQHFTFSKVMAWIAFDRCIKDAEEDGLPGPTEDWRRERDAVHALVCADGFDAKQDSFTRIFGAPGLDASCLLITAVA